MKPSVDRAKASPTKQFFVSMLTRDISLDDAILDLIDNCLDGALRLARGDEVDYARHLVRIEFTKDQFSIEDDCGGIPRKIAIEHAFKIGRDADDKRDSDAATIGMYGVGMKRALFKMGSDAVVKTRHGDDTFEVHIDSDWLHDKEWRDLPIKVPGSQRENRSKPGTTIVVKDLYPGVSKSFANESFENELRTAISHHFTVFLQRGLAIEVNGSRVEPVHLQVLVSRRKDGPAPYVYQKIFPPVGVGDPDTHALFHLHTRFEPYVRSGIESPLRGRDRELLGVIRAEFDYPSNDNELIMVERDTIPPAGEAALVADDNCAVVAKHGPACIGGIARANERTVILGFASHVAWAARVQANNHRDEHPFDNHPREDQVSYWADAKPMSLRQTIDAVASRAKKQRGSDVIEFDPRKTRGAFPEPKGSTPSSRRITFSRPVEELRAVSKLLFDDVNERPGVVGDKCFEIQLARTNGRGA